MVALRRRLASARSDNNEAMHRNLTLLWLHAALVSWSPWLPVLVLFTRREFGIDGALLVASVYYLAVVVAEVPSGWLSDRVGRVATLRIAAGLWVLSFTLMLLVASVGPDVHLSGVLGAQLLLAFGYASLSGTDVSFHYETLEQLQLEDAYEPRQGRLTAVGYTVAAASTVIGGLVGLIDLRLGFALALAAAVVQLGVTCRLTEPMGTASGPAAAFTAQLAECGRYLRHPALAWLFGYWIAMVVLEHVAFTLAQPYLTEVLGRTADEVGATPLVAGLQAAGFYLIGSIAAGLAPRWRRRLGLPALLILLAGLSATIVSAMALTAHVVVAVFMLLRSVQGAAAPVVMTARLHPEIAGSHRATYLSMHSLAGRAAYGSLLFVVSRLVDSEALDLSLRVFSVASWALVGAVIIGWYATRTAHGAAPDPDEHQPVPRSG